MPSYNAIPAIALTPGDTVALVNNAAVDGGVTTTQQVHVGPSASSTSSGTINIVNTTNQPATGQIANQADVTGDYEPASGLVVPAGQALQYNVGMGWVRFTFATAPTSGFLTISR
jgi:hypothetical protein